jgi:hypothetical protein
MESNWAAENLQVIRTLMERSAVYRRALAPITLTAGVIGAGAAAVGGVIGFSSPQGFVAYWMSVSTVALFAALLQVRRQALKEGEPFWSPPLRRVAQAFFPPLFVGMFMGLAALCPRGDFISPSALPAWWMLLYGCALHAAGFFMVRGIKLFGWGFVACGCAALGWRLGLDTAPPIQQGHLFMGATFGGLHLAYGIYLYFTEQSRKSA